MNNKYKMLKLKVDQVTDENKLLKMRLEESNETISYFSKAILRRDWKIKRKS